jgi:hypothetical protein
VHALASQRYLLCILKWPIGPTKVGGENVKTHVHLVANVGKGAGHPTNDMQTIA